ncbi:unnamed protein product [Spirodela intermedia]|uniref:Uncharacterized protein n=1 Tax=Spirodela intermedia TaxID=51605 RepID=A0A7I8IB69_SPIIN|nr:unnamed protein product [Spirodela intermedia]CAA6654131.1 unnamed protein product [Spirodela intermedia]
MAEHPPRQLSALPRRGKTTAHDAAAATGDAGVLGHYRGRVPGLSVLLLLVVAPPLLLWSIDTAVIRSDAWQSAVSSHPYPTAFIAASGTRSAAGPVRQIAGRASDPTTNTGVQSPAAAPPPLGGWISVELEPNLTSMLLFRWLTPGGEICRDARTTNISIPALDAGSGGFAIFSLYDGGGRRCLGGDYFETDLSGARWKARPPVKDHGDGSYAIRLQVHPDFAGEYNLTVVLLFRSFEGLRFSTERFAFRRELRRIPIRFRRPQAAAGSSPEELRPCRAADFRSRGAWSGRWTRHAGNDSCAVARDGRYRCLDPGHPAQQRLGLLGALLLPGVHAGDRLAVPAGAVALLLGDSNHVDTVRNMLNFVLGLPEVQSVPRRFDGRFTNPSNSRQWVRITSVFNGHWNETQNYQGLHSLRDDGFRALVRSYFEEDGGAPDAVVLNSGLHDGVYWRSIRAFAEGAEYAAAFWEEVLGGLWARGKALPAVFYRTTKMEAFNGVLVEKLRARGLLTGGVIDQFDMTFPWHWHWDNRCSTATADKATTARSGTTTST